MRFACCSAQSLRADIHGGSAGARMRAMEIPDTRYASRAEVSIDVNIGAHVALNGQGARP